MYSKGIFHLIEAISYMRQSNIPVELHICGLFLSDRYMTSSVLKKTFFDTISDNDNIFFHGFADSSKKSYFYSQADVFCLPTFYETEAQPISIIEAMSFGLPIVSTSFKYIPDLVSANSGILVPPKSSESIFDALKYLYYNRNVRKKYGYFNLTFHNKYFTKTVYFKNFAQLLNS